MNADLVCVFFGMIERVTCLDLKCRSYLFVDMFLQKGMALKTATSNVRNAYYVCLNACFHGEYGSEE